ncbi:MAG: XRE family transcriptional regulator [Gordonia sp. (in: high G+C Gram-positive bacteria)]|nr:MAG: XRE family transcriptional regulator [Gordonia sp. (in: high G+C Gram-positive bacteria)]
MWVIVNIVERLRELGSRVRDARTGRGQTQAEVAKAVGVHRTHLSAIESGGENITVGTLYRIADHFDIPASQLLPD